MKPTTSKLYLITGTHQLHRTDAGHLLVLAPEGELVELVRADESARQGKPEAAPMTPRAAVQQSPTCETSQLAPDRKPAIQPIATAKEFKPRASRVDPDTVVSVVGRIMSVLDSEARSVADIAKLAGTAPKRTGIELCGLVKRSRVERVGTGLYRNPRVAPAVTADDSKEEVHAAAQAVTPTTKPSLMPRTVTFGG